MPSSDNLSAEAKMKGWKRGFTFFQDETFGSLLNKGFTTFYASAPYYWGMYNPKTLEIVTNTEGDIDTFKAKDKDELIKEMESFSKFFEKYDKSLIPEVQNQVRKLKGLKEVI